MWPSGLARPCHKSLRSAADARHGRARGGRGPESVSGPRVAGTSPERGPVPKLVLSWSLVQRASPLAARVSGSPVRQGCTPSWTSTCRIPPATTSWTPEVIRTSDSIRSSSSSSSSSRSSSESGSRGCGCRASASASARDSSRIPVPGPVAVPVPVLARHDAVLRSSNRSPFVLARTWGTAVSTRSRSGSCCSTAGRPRWTRGARAEVSLELRNITFNNADRH